MIHAVAATVGIQISAILQAGFIPVPEVTLLNV